MTAKPQKIMTHLVFDNQAEEAVNFYVSIFKDGRILHTTRYAEMEYGTPGTVRTITFELFGQKFWAVNGGPSFKFSEGMSLYVMCDTQEEIDELWEKLSEGGQIEECGWLRDKFGVPWQIVPTMVYDMVNDPDTDRADSVVKAIMKMKKLDIETIKEAYYGQQTV